MGLFGFGRRKKEAALSSEELYKQGAELFDQGKLSAAITLLEKAAQLGHSAAQNHLGVDYQRGEGVPKIQCVLQRILVTQLHLSA